MAQFERTINHCWREEDGIGDLEDGLLLFLADLDDDFFDRAPLSVPSLLAIALVLLNSSRPVSNERLFRFTLPDGDRDFRTCALALNSSLDSIARLLFLARADGDRDFLLREGGAVAMSLPLSSSPLLGGRVFLRGLRDGDLDFPP